jgi:stage V sporulation protein S
MDRFFSKLDLRDIKIDPERSKFSPDDEFEYDSEHDSTANGAAAALDDTAVESPVDAWVDEAPAAPETNHIAASDGYEAAEATYVGGSDVLKVSSKSRPSAVAGAIAGVVRELGRAEVQAIGAGATNQAIKAVAIARDYLSETGIEAVCLPAFIDITIDNEDRTAIRLVIEPR